MSPSQTATRDVSTVGTNDIVRVFLSHKAEDAKAAIEIQSHLLVLGRGRLEVFVTEQVPFGGEYRDTLRHLALADKLILLYTDPHQIWDACLYESGFFDGRLFPDTTRRLIVLHDEDIKPPAPLNGFHSVAVSQEQRDPLRHFIHEIFAEEPRPGVSPIYPDLMKDEFAQYRKGLEDAIIKAVSGPQEVKVFAREIRIEVPAAALEKAKDTEVPREARVFADALSFQLFALSDNPRGYSWDEFYQSMDSVSDNTGDWVGALAHLMRGIALSSKSFPSTGLPLYRYSAGRLAQVYRPAIRSFRRKKDLLSFEVLFTDLPAETIEEQPGAATALAQALTVARMLRWGVLKHLENRVRDLNLDRQRGRLSGEEWSDAIGQEIHRFLEKKLTVYVEARNRGYQREDMQGYFDGERKASLESICARWDALVENAKELADRYLQRTAKAEEVTEFVRQSLGLNKEFMVLCADRYRDALAGM
jgi:hypothetical protein